MAVVVMEVWLEKIERITYAVVIKLQIACNSLAQMCSLGKGSVSTLNEGTCSIDTILKM